MRNLSDFWRRYKKNRAGVLGLALVLFFVTLGLLAPVIAPYDPWQVQVGKPFSPPSAEHWMGADHLGRDLYSQVLYGARVPLLVGTLAALFSTLIGIVVGAASGYFSGKLDDALMRVTELFMMIPSFFLLIVLVTIFERSIWYLVFVIGITGWPGTARLVRGEFLSLKEMPFVEAARSIGASHRHIIFREILPNAMPPIVVNASLGIGATIILETGLSFLGLGDPNVISWGNILANAQIYIRLGWHASVFTGLAIFLTVLGLNLLGDGLNDALNPRLKER